MFDCYPDIYTSKWSWRPTGETIWQLATALSCNLYTMQKTASTQIVAYVDKAKQKS